MKARPRANLTVQRDTAILLALRMARVTEKDLFRAAAHVMGLLMAPQAEPSAMEAHWINVIKAAMGVPAATGDEDDEDSTED